MNLELIDPFGRQIPDRIDSTLQLPASLHFRQSLQQQSGASEKGSGKSSKKKQKHSSAQQSSSSHHHHSNVVQVDADDQEWKAVYHLSFNRRGTYLAAGHGSGTVAVFNILSRSLAALYQSDLQPQQHYNSSSPKQQLTGEGVTSVTWSRRSRTLLTGAAGDKIVRVYDTTHPFGPEECCKGLGDGTASSSTGTGGGGGGGGSGAHGAAGDDGDDDPDHAATASSTPKGSSSSKKDSSKNHHQHHQGFLPGHSVDRTKNTSFADTDIRYSFVQERRVLPTTTLEMGVDTIPNEQRLRRYPEDDYDHSQQQATTTDNANDASKPSKSKFSGIPLKKHSCVSFEFPDSAVAGTLQINPRIRTGGIATLANGTLVLFYFHPSAFISGGGGNTNSDDENYSSTPHALIIPIWTDTSSLWITCAAFDHHGERVYAATRDGTLLGFDVSSLWKSIQQAAYNENENGDKDDDEDATTTTTGNNNIVVPTIQPHFKINVGGSSSSAWHLLVSRNGKYLVLNSADGALRLYSTQQCWKDPAGVDKPAWTFQDVVSRVKFACCDLSGDGEYVVGGANGDDNKYELYVWNTTTGALMDKLTGSSVQLYSVAWHPTRSFIAAATSDGIIDIWGPRINWTAFAPDFQALPMNVEYIEREDEFDIDPDTGKYLMEFEIRKEGRSGGDGEDVDDGEQRKVDVMAVEKVPVFASDSEDENEVFNFETKVVNLLAERGYGKKGPRVHPTMAMAMGED